MRKVIFNKYIKVDMSGNPCENGMGMLQTGYPNEGTFLGFGTQNSNTVALVEVEDGTVEAIPYDRIKFMDIVFTEPECFNPMAFEEQHGQEPVRAFIDVAKDLIGKLGKVAALERCYVAINEAVSSNDRKFWHGVKNCINNTETTNLWHWREVVAPEVSKNTVDTTDTLSPRNCMEEYLTKNKYNPSCLLEHVHNMHRMGFVNHGRSENEVLFDVRCNNKYLNDITEGNILTEMEKFAENFLEITHSYNIKRED